jgi:hypothetical protein
MGTPPAPPYATVTYGQHEDKMLPRWTTMLMFYVRFIDDVLGIWLLCDDPLVNDQRWNDFTLDMNGWNGLEWVCEKPTNVVNFMDLTIRIVDGKLVTTIFEKAQNLYLYIPPHSSHPKGVLTGLIFGQVLRIRRLCSLSTDADDKISQFFERLRNRGHSVASLVPLFTRAEQNALRYINRTPEDIERLKQKKWIESRKQVYFHLQFHPENPPSSKIQDLWKKHVSHPPNDVPLSLMKNLAKERVGFSKLVVAYSRPLNLQNRFSVRDIHGRGKKVSDHLA